MLLLVPFGRDGNQLAVVVPPGNVRQNHRGELAGLVHRLALSVEDTLILQILEDLLEPDPVVAFDAEALRDLPLADLALRMGDEGHHLLAGGQGRLVGFRTFGQEEFSSGSRGLVACKRGGG